MAMATRVPAPWSSRCGICGSATSQRQHNQQLASGMSPFVGRFEPPRLRLAASSSRFPAIASASMDHIPKRFHEDNLQDGLMDNFKNVPQSLYGLTPAQMDMFLVDDNPFTKKSKELTEESITSKAHYRDGSGVWSPASFQGGASRLSMSVNMYRGGGGGGLMRPKSAPPDLPSLLLDARIVYLGMAIVPAVTELIVAEMLFLDFDNPSKPIYLYINCSGTQNEKKESVGFETEAYAIADTMSYVKSKVYTVNCGMAFGQAAMLLSVGEKGFRAVQPSSSTKLYAPKVNQSSGSAIDMFIKAKELDSNTKYYIDLLAKGTGKPEEEIAKDIQRPKYFKAKEAVEYGLADKVIEEPDVLMDAKNYDELLLQSKAAKAGFGGRSGPQAAPAGPR
ncbi:ATP-dependent Clp protease proteolytic subunit-related protein 1, chloroplastic [Selaginella moellendorffii]|nr:ATP-dependent Clp protease proteolytic subunit-related protein 1, chloroplastic [Selaginella moellendorffii]|eukprot:XP_002970082.2 ATP-dependent Clp protease proteolytic subunit-related protein 1, chloroplastic [Selaginella moellendorffii]